MNGIHRGGGAQAGAREGERHREYIQESKPRQTDTATATAIDTHRHKHTATATATATDTVTDTPVSTRTYNARTNASVHYICTHTAHEYDL